MNPAMHKKVLKLTLSGVLLAAGAALLSAASCASQPPVKCTATSNPGAARFKLLSSTGDCSNVELVKNAGEIIGLQTYVPRLSEPDSYNLPNSVALKSEALGLMLNNGESVDPPVVDEDSDHQPYALGKFDEAFPDANDVCRISKLSSAEVDLGTVPAHIDADGNEVEEQPATHIVYEWSNVQIIVTAESIGTQTFADLTYTRDDCTAKFQVSILTPAVFCDTDGELDQKKCDAPTDPALGAVPPGTTTCEDQGGQMLCLPNRTQL